jgi:S-DNA-T family DNA segregation ATPase FtsK/SpoIIIE
MAQQKKKTSSKSGSGAKKQPTSTARTPSTTKKTSSSNTRKSTNTSKNTSTKTTAAKNQASRSASNAAPRRPIRRQVGCFVLLFLGLVAFISYFPGDGWLVEAMRTLLRGLSGWGFYLAPLALFGGSAILGFHRGRPVRARLTCALLLPILFGAFIHIISCSRDGLFAPGFGYGMRQLWLLAQDTTEHCGGVLGGILAIVLRKSISTVGGVLVLVVAFALMAIKALNLSVVELIDQYRARPKLAYELEEPEEPDEDDFFAPEDYLFPLNGGKPIRKKEPKAKAPARPAITAPEPGKAVQKPPRRRMYDEDWEQTKDKLFAAMDVDPGAAMRVAAALAEEQALAQAQKAADTKKPAKAKPEPKVPAKAEAKTETKPEKAPVQPVSKAPAADAQALTKDVAPLSVEEAANIAGVEIHSADLDAGAAAPTQPEKVKIDKDAEAALVAQEIAADAQEDKAEYIFPSLELLNKSKPEDETEEESLDETREQLEKAIRSFGVGASIVGAIHGPSITRYDLKLEQGVKLNKITNLAGDIALNLGVENVRIAPIPDKISTVGVEVPNRNVKTVWLGDVIDSEAFRNSKSKLSVAMGKDIGGNVIVGNIAKMPHVLIAGTTGSGKSVCINSLILSLLYKSTPEEVRMIMIDPKMVELGIYNGMPHLYVPVVTDPKKAAGALQWSVVEMLKRYRLFSEEGVRDLAGYNAVLRRQDKPILPQVVIIIDELADLMMVASKEVEESICRVAQMGRAAGMHLVVATQRPSADVITGLMKANIPSRIAFAVSSSLESRIILDQQGAEKLVGAGDMLYSPIGIGKPTRVQGAFVTDEEREEIINFVKREAEAEYSDEILAEIEKAAADKDSKNGDHDSDGDGKAKNDYDELLPQAVDVIFETKQASVSMLQRRLKLGYSRAARLIDQLEEVGVVGPYEGSKPRQIMITKQQWQEMQYSAGTAPVDTIAQEFSQVVDNDSFSQPAPEEEEATEDDLLPEAAVSETDTPQADELSSDDDLPWGEEDEP